MQKMFKKKAQTKKEIKQMTKKARTRWMASVPCAACMRHVAYEEDPTKFGYEHVTKLIALDDIRPLVLAVQSWIRATKRNRNNSDVKNYEEFALECMRAWDAVPIALATLPPELLSEPKEGTDA